MPGALRAKQIYKLVHKYIAGSDNNVDVAICSLLENDEKLSVGKNLVNLRNIPNREPIAHHP